MDLEDRKESGVVNEDRELGLDLANTRINGSLCLTSNRPLERETGMKGGKKD